MYSIVLIDDEQWALDYMEACLKNRTDFSIVGKYSSSRQAWKIIQESPPDVVFTDIRMPGVSGLELAKMSKEANLPSEFIIVSGYDDFDYLHEAICIQVFDYCVKPIEENSFDNILNRLKENFEKKHKSNNIEYDIFVIKPISKIFNPQFLNAIIYINQNYNKPLKLEDVATKFFISDSYLAQLFIKHFDLSFSKYLLKLRMENAALLLKNTAFSTSHVAEAVGYNDYYYFNKVFKNYFGETPYRYARRLNDEEK